MQEGITEEAADVAADAVFAAHDPGGDPDAAYITTLLVFVSPPEDDPDHALSLQEKAFRDGAAADAELGVLESYDIQRIELPAGPALRAVFVHPLCAQVQYYLHTPGWRFDIWFTSPLEGLPTREIEFEAMARTFELAENWRDFL